MTLPTLPKLYDRVKETSTTNGDGPILMDGPVLGHSSFGFCYGSGASGIPYCIDDGLGNWEIGFGSLGRGSASNYLHRDTVLATSVSNREDVDKAPLRFDEAVKHVYSPVNAAWLNLLSAYVGLGDGGGGVGGFRTVINTPTTFVVGTDYPTIQDAVDAVSAMDIRALVIISVPYDVYDVAGGVRLRPLVTTLPGVAVELRGDIGYGEGCPPAMLRPALSGSAFGGYITCAINADYTTGWAVKHMALACSSGCGVTCQDGHITLDDCDFGGCGGPHITSLGGTVVEHDGVVSGSAASHAELSNRACLIITGSLTYSGPTFSLCNVSATTGSVLDAYSGVLYGTAAGQEYRASLNSVIDLNGQTLPGDSAGALSSGSQAA